MSLAERKRSRRAAEQDGRPGTSGAPNTPVFEAMEPRLLLDGGPVVINEIMYHPGTGEPGTTGYVPENLAHEYIELLNTGPTAVNLLGWELTRGVNYTFGNVTIPSGGYLVVAANVDAFLAKYPGFSGAVVGGQGAALWDGHLSNSGEDVELEDALGARVDLVAYADEGDWAVRMQGSFSNFRGWEWVTAADGGGKSLELINPALPNTVGQNWKASLTAEGTPGQPNSVAAADIAPLIVDVTHLPAIPSTTDPVAITARLIDELGTGLSATLHWRLDGAPSFQTVVMHDDGISGDGLAGDGVWGAYIPPQATNPYVTAQGSKPVVEFYVEASDSGAKTRTWPAPTGDLGQVANALYQVDNTYDPEAAWVPTDRPIYRFIMRNAEWTAWLSAMVADAHSDAQMNVTFIAIDGTDVEVRYLTGVRNRGEGTRHRTPHNYHLNIPTDTPWYGLTAVNFNSQYTQCQMAGAAIFQSAGLPAADGAAIVLLTNGTNLANTGSPQYGSYFRLESYNSEFADKHFALDPAGNLYKGVSTSSPDADLRYINDNPSSYRMSYFKETNTAADDWSDLINLVRVLNTTPDDRYTEEVSAVVNVDEWLRYFAVDLLIGNRENSLGGVGNTGHYVGDDYSLYFGIADPRAQLVIHDLDTVLGQGDYTPAATSTPEGLFPTSTIPAIARFMKWKDFAPRYYAILKDLIATTFAPENINPLLDQVLGGWAPAATIASMKQYVVDRNAHILSLIPSDLTVTSGLAQQNGYDRTTVNTVNLTGKADAAGTARILVNGIETYYSPWEGTWDTSRAVEGTTLVAPGTSSTPAVWKYDDSGTDLGTAWRSPDPGVFDDSGWAAGPAQLGYSPDEYDEATTLDYGGNPSARIPTYYFRHHFNVANPSQYSSLTLRVKRDDGIAVYLNGTPVARDNLAADAVFSTYTGAHASDDGQSWIEFTVDASLLQATGNVLAVEIHQSFADSTDISFDLQLIGNGAPATVQLKPGLNRVVVQALDATGAEIDRATRDVWYDTSATNDQSGTLAAGTTTWTAEAGPYRITGNVTVPAGATLVIEPGTTVFFNAGTYMTINGKLDAQGTEYGHIRLTVTPGSANWAGLRFSGGTQPSLISYADIEYSSGSDSIDASGTAVHLDHITWANQGSQYYLDWHNASIILTNSILPFIPSHELFHFSGFPANGYALVQGNWFGGTTGYNDIIDFTGGNRPGPIVRFIGNVFSAGSDDVLDLDSTDAYIEGNVFMHIHQDGARDSKSYCITTGKDNDDTSQLTVVGNLFYDVDHALLSKGYGFITAVNNTIVDVHAVHADATSAVISFYEDRAGQGPGVGAYFDSNIILNVSALWENLDAAGSTTVLTTHRNVIYNVGAPFGPLPGVDNLLEDPRLVNPDNVTDPWKDFMLQSGSPAIGTGFNGVDIGGVIPSGASIAGEPEAVTIETAATLTIGGPDIYGYKYRVMKDGAWLTDWSAAVPHPAPDPPGAPIAPITPIVLTGLDPGTYRVAVVRQDSAGYWQGEAEATLSRAWTVVAGGPNVLSVRLNDRDGRSASAIEPSGIGVRSIDITFSEAVSVAAGAVTLRKVTFDGLTEIPGDVLTPLSVTGSGTAAIRIEFATASVVDTWVKVVLNAAGVTSGATGAALDGEPRLDSSGLGYIYQAADDLPTGDGTPGGDAVFYVGNLRGDMQGPTFSDMRPDGRITPWDINGFTIKYLAGNMDVDVWGGTFSESLPDDLITPWDINGFTILYRAAVATGRHLDTLPTDTGTLAVSGPSPLVLAQTVETPAPAVETAPTPAATETRPETATGPATETPLAGEVLAATGMDVLALVGELPVIAAAPAPAASAPAGATDLATLPVAAPAESFQATLAVAAADSAAAPEASATGPASAASDATLAETDFVDLLALPALDGLIV